MRVPKKGAGRNDDDRRCHWFHRRGPDRNGSSDLGAQVLVGCANNQQTIDWSTRGEMIVLEVQIVEATTFI
jgi:hypothetical protein